MCYNNIPLLQKFENHCVFESPMLIMHNSLILSLCLLSLILCSSSAELEKGKHHHKSNSRKKLFVFGDSYADTGNWNKSIASSWKSPYGITYPGKPAGRFSDGRILTDYVASHFRIQSPVPYEQWNIARSSKKLRFGMNFAYGGTGVFNTDVSKPNMTAQIDIFENLIKQAKVFTNTDLHSSIALVSLGGNDYSNYLKHGTKLSLRAFTKTVVDQLVLNIQRIQSLGVPKVAVTSMEPLGCLPAITVLSGYINCSESLNEATSYHNQLLRQTVETLNHQSKNRGFFILDLYSSFLSALQRNQTQSGSSANVLAPCCRGLTFGYQCGSMEGTQAKYNVCENPNLAFFWDHVHPAQHGWHQVYLAVKPVLIKINSVGQ